MNLASGLIKIVSIVYRERWKQVTEACYTTLRYVTDNLIAELYSVRWQADYLAEA